MSAPIAAPIDILSANTPTVTQGQTRARIEKSAKDFETQVLSTLMGQMFEGVQTDGPFGGGEGEAAFRSFLMDAFAKQTVKVGGVGIAASVQREMLKLQGLS